MDDLDGLFSAINSDQDIENLLKITDPVMLNHWGDDLLITAAKRNSRGGLKKNFQSLLNQTFVASDNNLDLAAERLINRFCLFEEAEILTDKIKDIKYFNDVLNVWLKAWPIEEDGTVSWPIGPSIALTDDDYEQITYLSLAKMQKWSKDERSSELFRKFVEELTLSREKALHAFEIKHPPLNLNTAINIVDFIGDGLIIHPSNPRTVFKKVVVYRPAEASSKRQKTSLCLRCGFKSPSAYQ
jgi:hypothetical protein